MSVAPAISAGAVERPIMQDKQLTRLVLQLLRPYRGWLLIVFAAMLVDISMSLAAPWPLKLVLDERSDITNCPICWPGRTTMALTATRSASLCSQSSQPC
jgi:hypothetical protein